MIRVKVLYFVLSSATQIRFPDYRQLGSYISSSMVSFGSEDCEGITFSYKTTQKFTSSMANLLTRKNGTYMYMYSVCKVLVCRN